MPLDSLPSTFYSGVETRNARYIYKRLCVIKVIFRYTNPPAHCTNIALVPYISVVNTDQVGRLTQPVTLGFD